MQIVICDDIQKERQNIKEVLAHFFQTRPLDFWEALTWYGLTLLIVLGYLLFFRTLAQRMEEVRIFNHDMHYHFTALSGLCMENNMDGIRQYVEAPHPLTNLC